MQWKKEEGLFDVEPAVESEGRKEGGRKELAALDR